MRGFKNSKKSADVLYGRPHFKLATVRAVGRSENPRRQILIWWAVNPISNRWADYANCITTCPPRFSDLPTALTVASLKWGCP